MEVSRQKCGRGGGRASPWSSSAAPGPFIQRVRRESVVALLLASIVVQYVAAVLILPMSPNRWLFSAGVFACGLVVFGVASLPSKSGDRGGAAPPA